MEGFPQWAKAAPSPEQYLTKFTIAVSHDETKDIRQISKRRMNNFLAKIEAFTFAPARPFGGKFFESDVRRTISKFGFAVKVPRFLKSVKTMPPCFFYQSALRKIPLFHETGIY